jgi:hypothetical protein
MIDMCYLCEQINKQAIIPSDFWKNFREIIGTEHEKEVIEVLKKSPKEFQDELTKHALVVE